MAIERIDIIQGIVDELSDDKMVFFGRDMLVGTVVADELLREEDTEPKRRLALKRGNCQFSVVLSYRRNEAAQLTLCVLVKEQTEQAYTAELQFNEQADVCFVGDRDLPMEKTGLINYIRRYAPQLFNEGGEVWFGAFRKMDGTELAAFWQRLILYAVLHGRAKARRAQKSAKPRMHTRFKTQPEAELSFTQANRGAFLGALFFFILLVGWFIWLRE